MRQKIHVYHLACAPHVPSHNSVAYATRKMAATAYLELVGEGGFYRVHPQDKCHACHKSIGAAERAVREVQG